MSMIVRELGSVDSDLNYDGSIDEIKNTAWGSAKNYIYNSRTGKCCERTGKQWWMMGFYYLGYTTFIVCLFLSLMLGSLSLVKYTNPDTPIIDKESLMENSHPGLGFVPNIVPTKYPIIWYSPDPTEERTEEGYMQELDKFFEKYQKADRNKYDDCTEGRKTQKPCYFGLDRLGECAEKGYQYTNSSLCFFLKLNRLRHWSPIYYKRENDFPDEMSQSMMEHIAASSNKDIVHVDCLGDNLWDNEYMGVISYYPQQGFDGYYFPYQGEADYLSPIVGVKLSEVATGVVIHIKCTVWVQNIRQRLNHLRVKVFIDNTLPY